MGKKIYLVTGASSDIGVRLITEILEESNKETVVYAHYFSDCKRLSGLEATYNNRVIPHRADFRVMGEVNNLIEKIRKQHVCPTHILHLPADKVAHKRFRDLDWQRFISDLNIQVNSVVEILKSFAPLMSRHDERTKVVIMLSSYTISTPPKHMSNYVMIKYCLLGLVKALASEYSGKNININGISPSMIETKFLANIDSRIIEINAGNSVGSRNATVDDIVPAIQFLLSDNSNFINGVNINISNGNVL